MNQINDKGQKHGPWEHYWCEGVLDTKGEYLNGFKHGIWESYWLYSGKLMEKTQFSCGKLIGFHISYFSDGKLKTKSFRL